MKKANNPETRFFTKLLLKWNREHNNRQMPWKGEKDPYKIWLSEIILQQTRVEQGLVYYNNFVRSFPDINKLARAPKEKIFKLWEGLGYYSRCRNLIASAKIVSAERKGVFPHTYEEIKALKGVGPYTAAAIASFAYNLPYAVVDGNVFRVLARVFGISKATDSTEGKKYFSELADNLLDKKQPGIYNQAIMDFGAVICKPAQPLCSTCVFNKHCKAFLMGKIKDLPVKEKKIKIRIRWFSYFIIEYKNQVAIKQRTAKDIWQGLCDFPLLDTAIETNRDEALAIAEKNKWLIKKGYTVTAASPICKQQLSHQLIAGRFYHIQCSKKPDLPGEYSWVERKRMTSYAFPQLINQYLKKSVIEPDLF